MLRADQNNPGIGSIYIGDVGDASWEEINVVKSYETYGKNFGWPCREGTELQRVVSDPARYVHPKMPIFAGVLRYIHTATTYLRALCLILYFSGQEPTELVL